MAIGVAGFGRMDPAMATQRAIAATEYPAGVIVVVSGAAALSAARARA